MKKFFLFFLILIFHNKLTLAQEKENLEEPWKNLLIQNSFLSDNPNLAPAKVDFTKPTGAENSYSIDAGIGYNWDIGDGSFKIIPNIEYHKNTLIKKEQDFLKGGVNLRFESVDFGPHDDSVFRVHPLILSNFKYNKNYADTSSNYEISILTSLVSTAKDAKYFFTETEYWSVPYHSKLNEQIFQFNYIPYLGLQYFNKKSKDTIKTDIIRFLCKASIALKPFPNFFNSSLVLTGEWQWRADLSNESEKEYFVYYLSSLSYYPITKEYKDKNLKIGIGIDYSNGINPDEGLEKQEVWKIALKLQFSK